MSSHSYDCPEVKSLSEQILLMGADTVYSTPTADGSVFYKILKGGAVFSLEVYDGPDELAMVTYCTDPKVSRTLEATLPECLQRLKERFAIPFVPTVTGSYNDCDEYSDKTKGFRNIMIFVGLVALGAIVACLLTG